MSAASVQRIGHYRLGRNLGIGSFGKVRLAEHQLTGHKVAVKILNRGKIKQLDMDEKVRREIKILKLFYHPHIIRLYEVIYTPSDIYMVTEFVAGGELFDFIVSNGRLPEEKARRFFQQIISGVEYCHQRMVVHRDLKPENLLLDNEHNVRIADFGLSNIMQDGDFLKTSCGSPNYAAPEVISGRLYAGPEVDVWSCGVILYALLCGTLPFDDENIPNLFKKIKGGIFTLPGHMSEQVKHLISCMLVVDPLKRITIPQIKNHPWFRFNLPLYLSVTPDVIIQQFKNIDFEVLDEVVMKIGFDKDAVVEALQRAEHNQMTVAYYLILDHKRRKQLQEQPSVEAGNAGGVEAPLSNLSLHPAKVAHAGGAQSLLESTHIGVHYGDPEERHAGRQWHLGITATGSPSQMMLEIFRALRVLNFEWKIVSQYQLKCRLAQKLSIMQSDNHNNVRPNLSGAKVKIGLQLYKMAEETYLLDIRKLDGETFPFMDACSALLNELKL